MSDLFLRRNIYKILNEFDYTRTNNMTLYATYCVSKLRNKTDNIEREFLEIFIYPKERKKYGIENFYKVIKCKEEIQNEFPHLKERNDKYGKK